MKTTVKLLSISTLGLFLVACSGNYERELYEYEHTGAVHKVVRGKVVRTRTVYIKPDKQLTRSARRPGNLTPTVMPTNSTANTQISARKKVDLIEPEVEPRDGTEYIIETKGGNMYALIEAGTAEYDEGDSVLIIFGAAARIIPDPGA